MTLCNQQFTRPQHGFCCKGQNWQKEYRLRGERKDTVRISCLGNDKEMSRWGKAESGEQRRKNEPEKHVENLEGDGEERLTGKKEREEKRDEMGGTVKEKKHRDVWRCDMFCLSVIEMQGRHFLQGPRASSHIPWRLLIMISIQSKIQRRKIFL